MSMMRDDSADLQAVSTRLNSRGRKMGTGCLVVFFAVFLLAGLIAFYFMFLTPVSGVLAARSWPSVPCVILSSQVEVSNDSDGDTYRVDIRYRYQVNGIEHQSNRYQFSNVRTSGRASKQAIVDRYPPGRETVCYVNPADADQATLNRDLTPEIWFGLFPVIFILVGGGGIFFTARSYFRRPPSRMAEPWQRWAGSPSRIAGSGSETFDENEAAFGDENEGATVDTVVPTGPVTLKPSISPLAKFLGVVLVALFWNGIVSIFVTIAVNSFRHGRPEWFLTIFLIPFVAVGLGLIGGIFYTILGMFNPRPELTLSASAVRLGDPLEVKWRLFGRTDSVRQLKIFLEGREEAVYRRGTSTSTDRSTFARLALVDTTNFLDIANGTASVQIPRDSMHSWDGGHNSIIWSLRVVGEIAWWPDIDENFAFTVLPRKEG